MLLEVKSRHFYYKENSLFLTIGSFPPVKSIANIKANIDDVYSSLVLCNIKAVKAPKFTDLIYSLGAKDAVKALNIICKSAEERNLSVLVPLLDKGMLEYTPDTAPDTTIEEVITELTNTLARYSNIIYSIDKYIPQYPVVAEVRNRVANILIETTSISKNKSLIIPGIPGDIFAEYTSKPGWLMAWVLSLPLEENKLFDRYKKLGHVRPCKPILGYQLDDTLEDPYIMRKYVWTGIFNKMTGFIAKTHNKDPVDSEYMQSLSTIPVLWKLLDLEELYEPDVHEIIPKSFRSRELYAVTDAKKTGITVYCADKTKYSSIPFNLSYLRYDNIVCREYDLITSRCISEEHMIKRSTSFNYKPSKHPTKDFIIQFTV